MVTGRTWKRLFLVAIILWCIGGGIYITLFFLFTPSQITSYTFQMVDRVNVAEGILISGDNESARYNDTDYLVMEVEDYLATVIHLDCFFYNVNATSQRFFWIRFNCRANITIGESYADIFYFLNRIHISANTSFVMRDYYLGVFNTTFIDEFKLEFYFQPDAIPFYLEYNFVELYYVEYFTPNYFTPFGIVFGVLGLLFLLYWYLNRRGTFRELDGRRVLARIQREQVKMSNKNNRIHIHYGYIGISLILLSLLELFYIPEYYILEFLLLYMGIFLLVDDFLYYSIHRGVFLLLFNRKNKI